MKNCPKNCGIPTDKKHCDSPQCLWYICEKDNIVFDSTNLTKIMEWKALP